MINSKKIAFGSLLILSSLFISSCAQVPDKKSDNPGKPTVRIVNISPTADREVFDLLPKGANNFTIVSKLKSTEVSISGYINFDDCTTEATGNMLMNGVSSVHRYINSGTGEAVSKDNGPWIDIVSPKAENSIILSPMFVMQNTVVDSNGVACSVSMLSELASVDKNSLGNEKTLVWDYKRTADFAEAQGLLVGKKVFKALGGTDLDIATYTDLLKSLFTVNPKTTMKMEKFIITKTGRDIIIEVYNITDTDANEPFITYTFTPTAKVNVVPVPYKTWYEELNTDFIASGLDFDEYIRK
jgi:hypothetical protein